MNNIEFEEKLARNGFTGKDIAAIRQYLGRMAQRIRHCLES